MAQTLPYIQVILAVLLMGGILIQRSDAGLGSAFGADSMGGTRYVRRGLEKLLFRGTILVAILFAVAAFLNLFVAR